METMTHNDTQTRNSHKIWPAGLQAWLRPFSGRLQWRLTVYYALFTALTVLVLGTISVALLWYLAFSSWVPNSVAGDLLKFSPMLAPYLESTPPDSTGLNAWLSQVMVGNHLIVRTPPGGGGAGDRKDGPPPPPSPRLDQVMSLAIVDTAGRVLVSYPSETFTAGAALPVSAEATPSFQAALRGESDSTRLAFRDAAGNVVAAAPIFGSRGRLVGVLYAEVAPPLDEAGFLQIVLRQTVLPVVLGVLVVGVVAGVLFGYFIARDLNRRLRALAGAADAWSDGDFDVLVTDNSGDELGQLAHRLNQMALQLQTLLHTRQELATLDERNRLARDLHDAVKQQVFATAMQVGAALALFDQNPAAAKARLVETDQLVHQTQQELTILIQELRPAALKDKGLATALREYVGDWSRQSAIAAEVRVRGEQSMSFLMEQSLFRVTQEALANIARHSSATQVEVELAWEGDQVTLSLADNGRGFNPATTNGKGVGLRSMRERVEAVGGQLSVTSQPGGGTRVTVRCKKTQK
jgi:NarL family two-component system sensor histidine kinase LiaS